MSLALVAAVTSHAVASPAGGVRAGSGHAGPVESGCLIEGDRVPESDRMLARKACESARARFAGLMGDAPVVRILVEARSGYRIGILDGAAVVLWPSTDAMRMGLREGPAAEAHIALQWRDVLRHEVGHALTAAHFYPDGRFEHAGYGTPLPDWFEEGLAIWAEPLDSRTDRVEAARELPRDRLELASILAMPHPATGDPAALAVRDGAAPPLERALWDFYQQSIAVLTFVHDSGGPYAIQALAERFRDDPDWENPLVGLPGLPATVHEVERAWGFWLHGAESQ